MTSSAHYITDPRFHDAPGVAISAFLQPAGLREIETVVVLSRAAGKPPMIADEVDAELADREGHVFPMISRPHGTLPEGGGMGVSANARFRFSVDGGIPAELKVRYRGETYLFLVKEAA
jgi:hypothetical protein